MTAFPASNAALWPGDLRPRWRSGRHPRTPPERMGRDGRRTAGNLRRFVHQTFGMTNPSIFRLLRATRSEAEMPGYSANQGRMLSRSRAARSSDGRRPGVLDSLTDRGCQLAIGSSGVRPNLELTVRECGLDGRFAAIASLEDITHGKPDPEVFLVAAARSGVQPAVRSSSRTHRSASRPPRPPACTPSD